MNEKIIDDLEMFEVKSWQELADAAQLIRKQYGLFIARSNDDLIDNVNGSPTQDEVESFKEALTSIDFFKGQKRAAEVIFLGAHAACIEHKTGDFAPDQFMDTLDDILPTGKLLLDFIEASCEITYIGKQPEKRIASMPNMREATDNMIALSLEQFFEGPRKTLQSLTEYLGDFPLSKKAHFSVKPDTVVQIVREEIGILPESIERLIRSSFNSEASLK